MKKWFNLFKKKPIFFLFMLIIIVFMPSAIAASPQSFTKLIITNFSIDKIGEEYEVSVIAYVPKATQAFSENFQMVTAKGNSLGDAMHKIAKNTGKDIGLAHCNTVMVNNELCDYGFLSSMDYLVREYSLGNNNIVINTGEDPAKDVLKLANEISKNLGISIVDITIFNEKKLYQIPINLEQIYNLSYSPSQCAVVSVISLSEDEGLEIGQESSGSAGQSSGASPPATSPSPSSSEPSKKKLINAGEMTVLRRGKRILDLTSDEVFSLGWGMVNKRFGILEIADYNDNTFTNANIKLEVFKNDVKMTTFFEEEKPVCEISINPILFINEVTQQEANYEFYQETFQLNSPILTKAVETKIGKDFSSTLKKMIDNNTDLLGIYENFYANNTQEFKNYLKNFENKEEYLSEIEFRIKVEPIVT